MDSGHHRTGVAPEHAGPVAVAAQRGGLRVRGYSPSQDTATTPASGNGPQPTRRARCTRRPTVGERRRGAGLRSGGSTPTAALMDRGAERAAPGVYAFNDAQQVELGAASWESVALTAAATVVSRNGRNLVLDAGSKVLGADRPAWATGHGRLLDHPEARVIALSEHHATVSFPEDGRCPNWGRRSGWSPTMSAPRSTSPTSSWSWPTGRWWLIGWSPPAGRTSERRRRSPPAAPRPHRRHPTGSVPADLTVAASSRRVQPRRSRCSSSGTATRRVVPSACRASLRVNGCGKAGQGSASPGRARWAAGRRPREPQQPARRSAAASSRRPSSSGPARGAPAPRTGAREPLLELGQRGLGRAEGRGRPGRHPAGGGRRARRRRPAARAAVRPAGRRASGSRGATRAPAACAAAWAVDGGPQRSLPLSSTSAGVDQPVRPPRAPRAWSAGHARGRSRSVRPHGAAAAYLGEQVGSGRSCAVEHSARAARGGAAPAQRPAGRRRAPARRQATAWRPGSRRTAGRRARRAAARRSESRAVLGRRAGADVHGHGRRARRAAPARRAGRAGPPTSRTSSGAVGAPRPGREQRVAAPGTSSALDAAQVDRDPGDRAHLRRSPSQAAAARGPAPAGPRSSQLVADRERARRRACR